MPNEDDGKYVADLLSIEQERGELKSQEITAKQLLLLFAVAIVWRGKALPANK